LTTLPCWLLAIVARLLPLRLGERADGGDGRVVERVAAILQPRASLLAALHEILVVVAVVERYDEAGGRPRVVVVDLAGAETESGDLARLRVMHEWLAPGINGMR